MVVEFTWEGKRYTGELKPVSGAGNVYHLMIRNYYQGQLVKTDKGWQFSTQKHGYIDELAITFATLLLNQNAIVSCQTSAKT